MQIFKNFYRKISGHFYEQNRFTPIAKTPPNYATVLIESRCSNKCIFCVNHSPDAKSLEETERIYNKYFSLNISDFKKIVDKLLAFGINKIHLCGSGEPLINKDAFKMMDYLEKHSIPVSFQTNFGRFTYPLLEEIAKRKIEYIGTDIVEGTKEGFERIKIGANWDFLFESLAKLAELCNKYNNNIDIHGYCVINIDCCQNLDKLINKCKNYNQIKKITLHNIHSFGFNKFTSFSKIIKVTDYEIIKKIKQVVEQGREVGIEVVEPGYYNPKKEMTCRNFWSRIMINFPNTKILKENWLGNVMPGGCLCATVGDFHTIGNLFKEPLEDIWNSPKMVHARTDSLNGIVPDQHCLLCPAHYKDNS